MNNIIRLPRLFRLSFPMFIESSSCNTSYSTRTAFNNPEAEKKKKTPETKVTLIAPDSTVSIVDLIEAHKISARRDLKLVKVRDLDSKTKRPIYRLLTSDEFIQEQKSNKTLKEELKKQSLIKGDKIISISTKIGEHDLMTRIKQMKKLVNKHYEVRIVLTNDSGDNFNKAEEIYELIESHLKTAGKLLQKRTKGNLMKFQVVPHSPKALKHDCAGDGNSNDTNAL